MKQKAALSRGRRRLPGDAAIATILAALTFIALTPFLDASMLSIRASVRHMADEGTILSNADRVSRGQALYREVFDFKGPISYLPYVVAYKVAPATARTGRLTMFVIMALWAAAMFETARRITRLRSVAVVVALWVPFQIWQAWTYAYQDFIAQLFLIIGLLTAIRAFERAAPRAPSSGRAFLGVATSGMCCALALWTSLAQGFTGLVALAMAIVLVAWITDGGRAGFCVGAAFGVGTLVGTGGVFIWLASMGAVGAGLRAMLVFPFAHYQAANDTTYAYDAPIYADLWRDSRWAHLTAQTILKATQTVPIVAVAFGLVVAAGLIVLLARPHRRSLPTRWVGQGALLARVALPASLAATAVPVVLSQTRSDICHIGFIEGGCVVALLGVFALRPGPGIGGDVAFICQRVLKLSLGATLLMAVSFYVHTLRVKPPGFVDLDAEGLVAFDGDLIAARTRPADRVFVTSYGGWEYLYSRRDNATSFALLIDDSYSSEQWPVAARQIVAHRPRLLLVPESDFLKLVNEAPQIGVRYFGYSGNYMLDDRGEGPPFALPASWEFTGDGIVGRAPGRLHVTIRGERASSRLLAWSGVRNTDMRAAIHGDLVSMFDGDDSYVGTLSRDGTRIAGTRFRAGGQRQPFVARRTAVSE